MEAGKRAPHTQTPPRSATGQVPAFHLAALPRVRRWSQRSRLYGVWVPGAAQPSRWLLRTIWLGFAIQFARRPPKFRGIHLTAVKAADAHVLWEESLSYWRRTWWYRSLQPIWRQGFSALTSLCPRKAVGYDQSWVCASWTGPFINLLSRCSCRTASSDASVPKFGLQHLTWKTRTSMCRSFRATGHSCGLRSKDEHISTGPALRAVPIAPCLHESSGGSPCSLERTGRAHSQLPRRLAHTGSVSGSVMRTQGFGALAPQPVGPSGQLGKEQTLADAEDLFSRYGVWIVNQTARLTQERAQSVLNCLNTFKNRTAAPLKQFQRLLGHMAAAAAVTPLGLLHMRPLQHWLHGRVPRWAWQSGTLRVQVTPACRQTFTPWSDLSFLRAGVPLEQVSRHAVVYTDASAKGWGATFNELAVSGVWTGPQLHWHINCLELLAVHLALNHLKRRLWGEHVHVRTDSTATVVYINRQGGLRSHRMSQLARHLLLWSRKHLRSLRAIHIPGLLNRTANELSRAALPGEWRLHPHTVQLIWRRFGLAQVDLFASLETSHCQLFYSLTEGTLGTDALAHSWPRGLCKYAFPPVSLLAQTLCKVREEEEQILLVAPYWPTRTWFPELMLLMTCPSLADSSEEGSTASETGHPVAPTSRPLETSCLVPGRDAEVLGDLPQEGVYTITSARTLSTRHAYCLEVEPVRRMVLFSQRRPREVPDQSRTVLFAATVGAKAVSLHP